MERTKSLALNLAAVGIHRALTALNLDICSTNWADVGGLDMNAYRVWWAGLEAMERAIAAVVAGRWLDAYDDVLEAESRLGRMIYDDQRRDIRAIYTAIEDMPEGGFPSPSTARELFEAAL